MAARSGSADLERLVTYVVSSLVDDPDAVKVDITEEGDSVRFDVAVAEDDIGKVIGRQGRIIKAIRTVARAAGSLDGRSVEVEVLG